jgi:hypothetical protein
MPYLLDTTIRVEEYNKIEDRYLIGFVASSTKKRVPLLFTVNTLENKAFLSDATPAIDDQLEINRKRNVTSKIPCSARTLLEVPKLYYGFTNEVELSGRNFEKQRRQVTKSLKKKCTEREIQRKLYGDELFLIVGRFKTKSGNKVLAIGKVLKEDGTSQVIHQVLAEENGHKARILSIGSDGLCSLTAQKEGIASWGISKQYLGKPKLQVNNVTYTLDYKDTFQFVKE